MWAPIKTGQSDMPRNKFVIFQTELTHNRAQEYLDRHPKDIESPNPTKKKITTGSASTKWLKHNESSRGGVALHSPLQTLGARCMGLGCQSVWQSWSWVWNGSTWPEIGTIETGRNHMPQDHEQTPSCLTNMPTQNWTKTSEHKNLKNQQCPVSFYHGMTQRSWGNSESSPIRELLWPSSAICCASSLVGASTSTRGNAGCPFSTVVLSVAVRLPS